MNTPYVTPAPSSPVDLACLAQLRSVCQPGEGPTSLAAVVGLFLELSAARLTEMQQALAAGDAGALRGGAHAVKGSAGLFGALGLSDLGAELEEAAGRAALDEAGVLLALVEAEMAAVEAVLVQEAGLDRHR